MFAALIPYAGLGYLLAAVLLLALIRGTAPAQRRWVAGGAVLALAGLGLHLALLAPAFVGGHATGTPNLAVMTLNLRKGGADATSAVALARDHHVGVLVLEEVTSDERDRLRAAGLDALLPDVTGMPGADDAGTMVFSWYPLAGTERLAVEHESWKVRVLAPTPFWLFAVHTSQPTHLPAEWAKDWSAIGRAVRATSGPRLVVGDFNATLDHRPVRDLLDAGFSDAAGAARSGWQPTWPTVPLFAIDHVLVSNGFGAVRTETATVPGTDHRALVAELIEP